MDYSLEEIKKKLLDKIKTSKEPASVLKSEEMKSLYGKISTIDKKDRADFGKKVNELKNELLKNIEIRQNELEDETKDPIDVTAPFDVNIDKNTQDRKLEGSIHPLTQEIFYISEIFEKMGFEIEDSREIDDQYHMFESLNFPKNHPARDDYDTFMTKQTDSNGDRLIAPAHTSTMQNRVIKKNINNLDSHQPIAVVVPDRVFRNEDLDARHEHTFYQIEGVFVGEDVNVGNLIATLQGFLEQYYHKKLQVRVNPFYFPFTEPSFEFALSCPFCEGKRDDCKVCSGEGWVELLGCGMIHPNVLKAAGVDAEKYTGFAFGCGIDRLVMMKYGIEDVRHFESGKLEFLKQF